MQGTVKRKFSTGDTTDDFILDYVDYQMHAKLGNVSETDTVFKFDEQTVKFTDFLANETNFSMVGYSTGVIAGLASLFAMLT